MARRTLLSEDEDPAIDLSPMIDCIFILLIFFIVTTVFVEEKGLQVQKPDAAASSNDDTDSESVTLEITADNKILIDDEPIAIADLSRRLKRKLNDPETPVVIRSHEKARHGVFVAVWDAAKRGGAVQLSFNTVN